MHEKTVIFKFFSHPLLLQIKGVNRGRTAPSVDSRREHYQLPIISDFVHRSGAPVSALLSQYPNWKEAFAAFCYFLKTPFFATFGCLFPQEK